MTTIYSSSDQVLARISHLRHQLSLHFREREGKRSRKSIEAEIKRLNRIEEELRLIPSQVRSALYRRGVRQGTAVTIAVQIATGFHNHIAPLWRSKYASASYGNGGQRCSCWDGPWKRWWDAAGARWEIERRALRLVIENSRGERVIAMRMPRSMRGLHAHGCTHGDAYSIADRRRPGVVTRYSVNGERTGVAVRYTHPESERLYWEHGVDVAECEREYQRKVRLVEEQRRREREAAEERRRLERERARQRAKEERRARLFARLSDRVLVRREDAYAAGACRAGVEAWCERVGISPQETARPAREILELARRTGERMAIAAAIMAARRALASASTTMR